MQDSKAVLPQLNKHYKIIVFFLTALNTLFSHLISLLPIPTYNAAIGSVIVLAVCLALYFIVSIVVTIIELYFIGKKRIKEIQRPILILKGIKAVSSFIGGVFYYFADNVPIFVYKYSQDFGCDRECKDKFASVGIVTGITAVLFYSAIPILTKRWRKICKIKISINQPQNSISKSKQKVNSLEFQAVCKMTMNTLVQIVTLDTWLTPIANLSLQTPEFCPQREIIAAWVAYVVYLVLWTIIFVSDAFKAKMLIKEQKFNYGLVAFFMFLLWLSSVLFPLVNNQQPLGCATHCDFSVTNTTINDIFCDERLNHGIQFGFLGFIESVVGLMLTILIINFWFHINNIKQQTTRTTEIEMTTNTTAVPLASTAAKNNDWISTI